MLTQRPLLRGSTRTGRNPFCPFHIWLSAGEWLFWDGKTWGRQLSVFSLLV